MTAADSTLSLSRIGQIAVTVTDMDRAVAYYRDVCGMRFLFRAPNVAFFDCDGIRLMLGHSKSPNVKSQGTVIYYRVENIQRAFDILKARNACVESPPHLIAKMPDHDLWMAFIRDPDENMLGIMEEVRAGSVPT